MAPNMFKASNVGPGAESSGGRSKMSASQQFISSQISKYGASRGKNGMSFKYSKAADRLTSMKHELSVSRIIVDEEINKGAIDLDKVYSGLFSTSNRTRSPQTDAEFDKRANEADKVTLEMSPDQSTAHGKQAGFEKLMKCVWNCGFEFDNEGTFLANKNALRRTANLEPHENLDTIDSAEEDE